MALTGKLSVEVTLQTPAAKYFNIFITQFHKFQNICERIHEAKMHEGDNWHVPHSVKNWTLIVDGKPIKLKEKIEAIDKENKSVTYNFFDGDISKNYKVFKVFLQVFEKSDNWHVPHSVKNWTLIVDGKPIKLKEKIEAIDKENKSITYNLFDGDISKNYKVFKFFFQVFEKSDGGATAKFTIEYEKINENVEAPYGFMEFFDKGAKEVDSYLLKA
ncbi:MLP-like protein [Arachis hypogaea]|nr:MLP-like protein [Arachis hypogaea]